MISTCEGIEALIDDIQQLPTGTPSLFIDLEGVKLSRHGSLSLLLLHIAPLSQV